MRLRIGQNRGEKTVRPHKGFGVPFEGDLLIFIEFREINGDAGF